MGSGFEGCDISHEGVQPVVGLVIGFVFAIASAPSGFLYLKQQIHDYKKRKQKKEKEESPLLPSSFSSAPPPAIEISTPWEIIVRASSPSELPRLWQLLRGLSRLHLFPLSGAFGLPTRGLWIPSWFRSCSLCVDVPTLYPALRDASRLAFCTVGNPFFIVNTPSLVSGYGEVVALVALLSGIALSAELFGRYGR